jgi:hypothetical protein
MLGDMDLGNYKPCFAGDLSMKIKASERRRFERYPVDGGLLFSDNDHLIGLAQVIDISKCGVRCVSLSKINCTICMLKNIELFGPGENMSLTGLSGQMTRCSDDLIDPGSDSNLYYYEFGFEFFPYHYNQINKFKKSLST